MSFTFERLSNGGRWEPAAVGSLFADKGLCGVSANQGLLRFHDATSGPIAQNFLNEAYAPRGLSADTFAFDWMARQFAVTTQPIADDQPSGSDRMVVVLDPSDMSVTPWVPMEQFEQALGVPLAQEFLREDLFRNWLYANRLERLAFDRCAGVTVPAFYGGEATIANLDHNDIDVYLTFIQQLWARAAQQAPGTPAPHIPSDSDR